MRFFALLLLAVGVSMDAFSVSVCKGLAAKRVYAEHILLAGIWFGGFQMLMPMIGYLLASAFGKYINIYAHWIAFLLLSFLGGKMIVGALRQAEPQSNASFSIREMFPLAIATSVDALAVGVSLLVLPQKQVLLAVTLIGATTFCFSAVGVKLGSVFGAKYQNRATLTGGAILILVGIFTLLEHADIF